MKIKGIKRGQTIELIVKIDNLADGEEIIKEPKKHQPEEFV